MSSENWESVAHQFDEIIDRPSIAEAYRLITQAHQQGLNHPEILWRIGRASYEMSQETANASERDNYVKSGLALTQQSVDANPNIGAAHKWLGILISAQRVGTKEKVANAYIIRDHFLKAIELDPSDSTALHAMGNWCFSVIQVSWLERKAAEVLFGKPPTSTYEECLQYLLKSNELKATAYNSKLVGDVYYSQKKYAEAKQWYQQAVNLPVTTNLQKRHHDEAESKMKKL